jgi:hypothetical protein
VAAGRLKQPEKIGEALGRIKNKYKVGKDFECMVGEGRFSYRRRPESIAREAELDGCYVIRTSVPAEQLPAPDTVLAYKRLAQAEAGLPNPEVGGSTGSSHPPLDRRTSAGPLPALHAGLLGLQARVDPCDDLLGVADEVPGAVTAVDFGRNGGGIGVAVGDVLEG